MTVELGRYGIWVLHQNLTPALAVEAERLGYDTVWIGGSPPGDLVLAGELLEATERISVATGIVNIWNWPAPGVAEAYHAIDRRFPSRFMLGVGVGHPEVIREYRSPLESLRGYLNELDSAGVPVDNRILAALGPKVTALAGDRSAGAAPYLTTPHHTATTRSILGEGPILAPEQKVVVTDDPAYGRLVGRPVVQNPYLSFTNYRRNLIELGFTEEDCDSASDGIIDALVVHGGAEDVAAGLNAHIEAGADHVAIQILTATGSADDEYLAALRALAASLGLQRPE